MMRDYDIKTTTPMVTIKAMLMTESYANDRKSSKIMYISSLTAKKCAEKIMFLHEKNNFALLFENMLSLGWQLK